MNQEYAIEVNNVHKYFKIYPDKGKMLRERIIHWNRNKYEKRTVLDGISFNIKKGEAVGIIGANGCGKSTTLKLLTRILKPNEGTITINGRVYSMIELGAGFHPDMTGRENIYINASIYGLNRKEVDKRIDDIIRFSELEEFIDTPVRTYSSGMYMRLAFSVAINMDTDILLIDEILAVGDANFQEKCFNKLREIKAEGKTIVIVSHAIEQINQLCDKSIWIKEGKIEAIGSTMDVDAQYLQYMHEKVKERAEKEAAEIAASGKKEEEEAAIKEAETVIEQKKKERWGTGKAYFSNIRILDKDGAEQKVFESKDCMNIEFSIKAVEPMEDVSVGFSIIRNDGLHCYGTNLIIDKEQLLRVDDEKIIVASIEQLNLLSGEYYFEVEVKSKQGETLDFLYKTQNIKVVNDKYDVGVVRLQHKWKVVK